MKTSSKSENAFRTIGELADDLGVQQHILRYWETRFEQLRPMQRAGGRRYYRPADVALATRINQLLNHQGYTVKGVQKLLVEESDKKPPAASDNAPAAPRLMTALQAIRNRLARALAEDDVAARL